MFHQSKLVCLALAVFTMFAAAVPASAVAVPHRAAATAAGKLPLSFEINEGQTGGPVKFLSRGRGYSLFLTQTDAVLRLRGSSHEHSVLRWHAVDGNPNALVTGENLLPGKTNYLVGDDHRTWHTGVANFAGVRVQDVYPGIDLVYHGNGGQLEYDFVVAPNTDSGLIRLAFRGIQSMDISQDESLILHTNKGDLVQPRPVVYQELNGQRQIIEGRYAILAKNEIGFVLGTYDHTRQVTIDPVMLYSTFLGGTNDDEGLAIAVDSSGNSYVTGIAASPSFPGVNGSSIQPSNGNDYDAFVTKISADGTAIIYSTYLGGDGGNEYGLGITVDGSDNVYITGATNSTNFPGTSGSTIQSSFGGGTRDSFATKINADGTAIVYSTYLGGSDDDLAWAIAVDGAGNAYVAGSTASATFPGVTAASLQSTNGGSFVTKINATGTATVYSTFFGGTTNASIAAIALDAVGNAYLGGSTGAAGLPGVRGGSIQPTFAGGASDGFVSELSADGRSILWSTYLGDAADDGVAGLKIDANGDIYVAGSTTSTSFPGVTASSIQSSNAGGYDAYVTKMNGSGTSIIYSTFIGGNDLDMVSIGAFGIDSLGNAYVGGGTLSTTFSGVNGSSMQSSNGGGADCFLTKINAAGTAIDYSTFLGGASDEDIAGIAIDASGNVYVTGGTGGPGYPVAPGALQPTYGGGWGDAFVTKIGP